VRRNALLRSWSPTTPAPSSAQNGIVSQKATANKQRLEQFRFTTNAYTFKSWRISNFDRSLLGISYIENDTSMLGSRGSCYWGTGSTCSRGRFNEKSWIRSRYLDRKDIAVFSREIEGLVAYSFRRAVQREVVKRNRLVPLDGSGGLSNHVADETWRRQVQARLELQELVGFLADRSRSVLALRYAGYTWKETTQVMGDSVAAVRSAFWRDVARVKGQLTERLRQ
jgi:hypothetical protein